MPTIRRELRICPACPLPITVVPDGDGTTFEYDMAEWARLCRHSNSGSPVACPGVTPTLADWLDRK